MRNKRRASSTVGCWRAVLSALEELLELAPLSLLLSDELRDRAARRAELLDLRTAGALQ